MNSMLVVCTFIESTIFTTQVCKPLLLIPMPPTSSLFTHEINNQFMTNGHK